MYLIRRLDGLAPESFQDQIRQLVIADVSELSSVGIRADNPLYPLYQYGVGLEVHQYVQALDSRHGLQVELTLALDADAPERLLGFALTLPASDDPQACAVAFLAVLPSHRRQGIARSLLEDVGSRYSRVELQALAHQVPWFEAMGFQAVTASGPQVVMTNTGVASNALIGRLDIAPLYQTLEVGQIHAYLLNQHGEDAMIAAEQQRDARMDQLSEQALACLQVRQRRH